MAISHLSRRFLSPTTAAARLLPDMSFSMPHAHARDPLLLLQPHRRFSTTPETSSNPDAASASSPNPTPASLESMKHQEIEGPTVERDISPLADEARGELDALRGAVRRLSASFALLGGGHLAAGAWIAYGAAPVGVELAAAVQGVVAFAFPFTAALVLRRAIKPIAFFQKMEANGRLQVLTLCLQATKNVNLMLLRTRVVAISCALGLSVGSVAAILMRSLSISDLLVPEKEDFSRVISKEIKESGTFIESHVHRNFRKVKLVKTHISSSKSRYTLYCPLSKFQL